MNLKGQALLTIFIYSLSIIAPVRSGTRMCKTQILRSFGFHSKITPNRLNSACPKVSLNCCSTHDQMRMHKIWHDHGMPHIDAVHKGTIDGFLKLRAIFAYKERIKITAIVEEYSAFFGGKTNDRTINHLDLVAQKFKMIDGAELLTEYKSFPKLLAKMYAQVKHMRKSFLCTVCDWNNHRYFNTEAYTLTYSEKFCLKIVQKFIDTLSFKYEKYIGTLLLLDEFVYIITDKRLLPNKIDRQILQRYILIIQKCKANPKKLSECEELCKQFSLNKFTYMFDGEQYIFKKYIENFLDVAIELVGEKDDFIKLFKKKKRHMSSSRLRKFAKKHSILSKTIKGDPIIKIVKKNTFDLKFKSDNVKSFHERHHPLNSIQFETLDDELSSVTLYRLADDPVDISNFTILFDTNGGLDLFRDARKVNLDIRKEKLLALIHSKGSNADNISEVLDHSTTLMLKSLVITDISNFIKDTSVFFKKMGKKNAAASNILGKLGEKNKKEQAKNVKPDKKGGTAKKTTSNGFKGTMILQALMGIVVSLLI